MAVLELPRNRTGYVLPPTGSVFEASRRSSRARAALETFLALVLLVLGIFVLRLVLVLTFGTLG